MALSSCHVHAGSIVTMKEQSCVNEGARSLLAEQGTFFSSLRLAPKIETSRWVLEQHYETPTIHCSFGIRDLLIGLGSL